MLESKSFSFSMNFSFLSAGKHFSKVSISAVPGIHRNINVWYHKFRFRFFSTSLIEIYNNFSNFLENYSFKKFENIFFFKNIFFLKTFFFKIYEPNLLNFDEKCFWISFIYFTFTQKPDDVALNQALMENQNIIVNDDLKKQLMEANEEYFLKQLDVEFRSKITSKLGYFSNNFNSFEFESPLLFSKNSKFENYFFDGFLKTASFIVIYELLSSYYFEPFFFFREKIDWTMTEFWLVCYFWEWSVVFEEWVYHPKIVYNDPKHTYPPLSHLSHKSDFDFSYKLIANLFDYKNTSPFSYYLEFQDFQTYAFDKNYVYLWDYNIGTSNPLNVFGPKGWTGYINFLREKLASPKIQFPSNYYWNDLGYDSFATRTLNFAFFPDQVLLWGMFNPNFDWLTAGYNWFFHFGDTYIDYCIGLDLIWYQITENYWGDFEYIVEDFTVYQTTYFPDSLATIWLPVILLATKNYTKSSDMSLHINDFNGVFHFKNVRTFEDFNSEKFFSLDRISRLEKLRDFQQIDEKPFHLEKIFNIFYAYNFSCFTANFPTWLLNLVAPEDLYSTLIYDYEEDFKIEEWEWIIVKRLSVKNYDNSTNLSIYFKTKKFDNFFFNLPWFLNEKIFDDIGFFYGSLNWTEKFQFPTNLTWLNTWSLLTVEYIPIGHFSWRFTFFESTPLWFVINLKLSTEFFFKFFDFFYETFTIKIVNHTYLFFIENKKKIISYNLNLPSIYFEINLLPTFEFIFSNIDSWFYDENSIAYLYYKFYEGNLLAFLNLFIIYNFINLNNFIYNINEIINTLFSLKFKIYLSFSHNLKLESDFFTLKFFLLSFYNFLFYEKICYLIDNNIKFFIKNIQTFIVPEFFQYLEIFLSPFIIYKSNNQLLFNNIFFGGQLTLLYHNLQPIIVIFLNQVWYFFLSAENFIEIWTLLLSLKSTNYNSFVENKVYSNKCSFTSNKVYIAELPLDLLLNKFKIINLLKELCFSFITFEYRYTSVQHIYINDINLPIVITDYFKSQAAFLPIEFFLPIFKYNSDWYLLERCILIDLTENLSLPDGSQLLFNDLWQIERFISYCIVLDIQLKNYNQKELMEIISAINAIDFSSTKNNRLEYDRYVNYVLWKKLYKKKD